MADLGYVLAKIHGIHSKSVIGDTLTRYSKIDSIDKLEKALFAGETAEAPTKQIYTRVEDRFRSKIISQITDITDYLGTDNPLINAFLMRYEIENVKRIIRANINGEKATTGLTELVIPKGLDYKLIAKTDLTSPSALRDILTDTVFSFVTEKAQGKNTAETDILLDKFYYTNLLKAAQTLPKQQQEVITDIITDEINLTNIIWVLRLTKYYNTDNDKIRSMIIETDKTISADILLEMVKTDTSAERRAVKKYQRIFGSQTISNDTNITKAEQSADEYISRRYVKLFTQEYNILSVVAYIYIKMKEYSDIVRIVESLRYKA